MSFRMHTQSSPTPINPRHGVIALTGYGITVRVERGYLTMSDGLADERRSGRIHKTERGFKRLVILGHTGSITLEAIKWLHDAGVTLVQIDADARVLLASAKRNLNDARLRRAQALATENGVGLALARDLIARKLDGQASVARDLPDGQAAVEAIGAVLDRIPTITNIDDLRLAESEAAKAYWTAWAGLPMNFAKKDQKRIPTHWRTFGTRISTLTNSPRRAINPANATLNYLYAILEAETTLALHTLGLDLGLGIMHADQVRRDSLTLDVMEAARPDVDAYTLQLLQTHPLRKTDFFEINDGGTRILPPLTRHLAETAPRWGAAIARVAESVAAGFLKAPGIPKDGVHLSTPLSETHRSRGRRKSRKTPARTQPPSVSLPRRCARCGSTRVEDSRRLCDTCLEEHQAEASEVIKDAGVRRLHELRSSGSDPAHTVEANAKRGAKVAKEAAARAAWDNHEQAPVDAAWFRTNIAPGLNGHPVREIVAATGLSLRYAALIRKGERVPHPRHWQRLAQLAKQD